MKTDIITVVILVFCLGVVASALATSDLFSRGEVNAAVMTAQD